MISSDGGRAGRVEAEGESWTIWVCPKCGYMDPDQYTRSDERPRYCIFGGRGLARNGIVLHPYGSDPGFDPWVQLERVEVVPASLLATERERREEAEAENEALHIANELQRTDLEALRERTRGLEEALRSVALTIGHVAGSLSGGNADTDSLASMLYGEHDRARAALSVPEPGAQHEG